MKKVRVLHVIGGFMRGGVETYLVQILRHIDRDRFKLDFLVHTKQPCAYDDEVRRLGSKIIPCLHPRKPLSYRSNFLRILRDQGPYDIVHSHVHHYSGFVLKLAAKAGVPKRIAHSHSDTSREQRTASVPRKFYFRLMKRWIARYATVGIAVSGKAASALFGDAWESDNRWRVFPCGIDLDPFRKSTNREAVRAEFGFSPDDFVIGHVGSFRESKNHGFLVEVAAEVRNLEPKMRLLLIGDGQRRAAVEQQIVRLGLSDRTVLAGSRADVPRLMLGAMDLFLFPSLFEGLGLVLVESQAAGLPCLISDVVPEEADLYKPLVRRLSLSQPASQWAKALLHIREIRSNVDRSEAFSLIENSHFNIKVNLRKLEEMYLRVLKKSHATMAGA